MAKLTDTDKKNIANAIAKVESSTSGELITVIAHDSDSYLYIPVLWAALAALLVPLIFWLSDQWYSLEVIYLTQFVVFLSLGFVFRWDPIKMKLIPKQVKYLRAGRVAREQFFSQNLHQTTGRTGVLIFVSLAEHYVEIIADKGINDVVPEDAWEQAVSDFLEKVKAGQLAEGFLAVVKDCGELLKEHFPDDKDNKNELPNHFIEI